MTDAIDEALYGIGKSWGRLFPSVLSTWFGAEARHSFGHQPKALLIRPNYAPTVKAPLKWRRGLRYRGTLVCRLTC